MCAKSASFAALTRKLATVRTRDLFERECLFFAQSFPHRNNVWVIDGEHLNRDPTNRCSTSEDGAYPLEMFSPPVHPGIEEPDELSRVGICSGEIRTFVPVAVKTGEGEVLKYR
jgi:hypothetical protein